MGRTGRMTGDLKVLALVLSTTAFVVGCLGSGGSSTGGSSSDASCGAVTKTIAPVKIDGHKHIYFTSQDFRILLSPSFRLSSIMLYADVRAKKSKTISEVTF